MIWPASPHRPLRLLLTCACAALLTAPASASAAAWVAPGSATAVNGRSLSAPAVDPQLRVDAAGDAVLAAAADKGPPRYIQVASRPAGGTWSSMQEVGTMSTGSRTFSLDMDGAGNAVVAFTDNAAGAGCPCLRIWGKPAGSQAWSQQAVLQSANPYIEPDVALAPASNGAATVVWHRQTGGTVPNVVEATSGTVGAWPAAPVVQSVNSINTQDQAETSVAIDGQGLPVIMWTTIAPVGGACPCTYTVRGRLGPVGRAFTSASNTADSYGDLFEATDGQDNVAAAWVRRTAGVHEFVETTAYDAVSGNFSAVSRIASAAGTDAYTAPQVAAGPSGEGVAIWEHDAGANEIVESSVRAGGLWGLSQAVTPTTGNSAGPSLALDGGGTATAVWRSADAAGTAFKHQFARHTAGGAWSAPGDATDVRPVSPRRPVAAADDAGHVQAIWLEGPSFESRIYDPVAPSVSGAQASGAPAGQASSFTATAADLWSTPVALTWDFGDGSSDNGASLTHAYAQPGTYTARLVATDAAGNTASQDFQVAVPAPPPVPTGLARPIAGKTANAERVSGSVRVKARGATSFVPLVDPRQIAPGAIIDATNGVVRITIDNGQGGLDTAEFYGGLFEFLQPAVKPGHKAFAVIVLKGGNFKGCPRAPKAILTALAAGKKRASRSVRHLWADGKGAFRTVGRFSSATIRGTKWLTDDKCNGTLTKVKVGKVAVRDFVKRNVRLVKAGKTYFARPKR